MKTMKLIFLSAMTVVVMALAGCSDRSYEAEIQRSAENADDLRDRLKYTQSDR